MKPWHVPIVGPLSPLAPGFRECLARQGYKAWPASRRILLLGRMSRWLAGHNLRAVPMQVDDSRYRPFC